MTASQLDLLDQLEEDMYGNEKRSIPGVIRDLSNLKKMMKSTLFGIAIILSNLLGLWRVNSALDLSGIFESTPVAVEVPTIEVFTEAVDQADEGEGADQSQAPPELQPISTPDGRQPLIEVAPGLLENITKTLFDLGVLFGLP